MILTSALCRGHFHVMVIVMKKPYIRVDGEVFINLEEAVNVVSRLRKASTPGTYVHWTVNEVELLFRNLLKEANDKPHS